MGPNRRAQEGERAAARAAAEAKRAEAQRTAVADAQKLNPAIHCWGFFELQTFRNSCLPT